jgi:hypothetical protein
VHDQKQWPSYLCHLSRSEWLTPAIGQARRLSCLASRRICTQPEPEIAAQLMCIYGMHSEAKLIATFVCQGMHWPC